MKIKKTLFISWLLVITYLSLTPAPEIDAPNNTDKLVHLVIYFVTTILFFLAYRGKLTKILLYSIVFSVLYGAFIEVLQYFLPFRSFSLADMMANSFGALLAGIYLYKFMLNSRKEGHE